MKKLQLGGIFLIVKIFQLLSSFALGTLLMVSGGSTLIIGALLLFSGLVALEMLTKKILPPTFLKFFWIAFYLIYFALAIKIPFLSILFLVSFFLYLLVGSEAEVLKSIKSNENFPGWLILLAQLIPIGIFYFIPQQSNPNHYYFYILTSILAYSASYAAGKYGGGKFIISQFSFEEFILGASFILGSSFIYYIGIYKEKEAIDLMVLALIVIFQVAGMSLIYGYLNTALGKKANLG